MGQLIGYTGPRPHRDASVQGYQNRSMNRQDALDIAADVGRLLHETSVILVPTGDGYDLKIPAESIALLVTMFAAQGKILDHLHDLTCGRSFPESSPVPRPLEPYSLEPQNDDFY